MACRTQKTATVRTTTPHLGLRGCDEPIARGPRRSRELTLNRSASDVYLPQACAPQPVEGASTRGPAS
jgi:hypothetical protein